MGRLTASLLQNYRHWERSTRIAFGIAIGLMLLALILLLFGPPDSRQPALIGFIGLLIASQIVIMWGNRHMVTTYTQAQRFYLAEDFQSARRTLADLETFGKADANALTLLANTYRQLGMLDESEEIVKKALALRPFDPFPLYAFGRTLLVKGLYIESVVTLRQALEAGAPPLIHFDLGEALFRQGAFADSQAELEMARHTAQENFRLLMTAYLLHQMGVSPKPTGDLILAGLSYWRDHAERFSHTPYGQALAEDVRQMQSLMEEI